MDTDLLAILCCPNSKLPLRVFNGKRLEHLNAAIARGQISTIDHQPQKQTLAAALISCDNKLIYPVINDKPCLIPELAIASLQLDNF